MWWWTRKKICIPRSIPSLRYPPPTTSLNVGAADQPRKPPRTKNSPLRLRLAVIVDLPPLGHFLILFHSVQIFAVARARPARRIGRLRDAHIRGRFGLVSGSGFRRGAGLRSGRGRSAGLGAGGSGMLGAGAQCEGEQ